MHTTMRSQDVWRGFCYDIFTATVLQELLAGWLGAEPGSYLLSVDSLHLYARYIPNAQQLPPAIAPGPQMPPLATAPATFDDLLGAVIAGRQPAHPGWAEVALVMASYRARKAGDPGTARAMAASCPGPLAAALTRWYARLDRQPQPRTEARR